MRFVRLLCLACLAASLTAAADATVSWLGPPNVIADGAQLYQVDRTDLVTPATPQSLRLLRLDPARVSLSPVIAQSEVPGLATVPEMARRHEAVAAINAGFFAPGGDPAGVLRIDGRLVSDSRRARGALALLDDGTRANALFDRVTARVRLRFRAGGRWRTVPVDGVDAPRTARRLILYSPGSGPSTDTATGGLEWALSGSPLRASAPATVGDSAIPPGGYVLSYGGSTRPAALAGLTRAAAIQVRESLTVVSGERVRDWMRAPHIVSGAGLLMRNGERIEDWTAEQLSAAFATTRHPRTLVARSRDGALWLVTVDGRQPARAAGMTFAELQDLCARLDATDCLNLDGGGSTTMVVNDEVVNTPSDVTGPRRVSDALIVRLREPETGNWERPSSRRAMTSASLLSPSPFSFLLSPCS